METNGVVLSDEEVRSRFSAYHDGELSADEATAVRARLDDTPALAQEYEKFCQLLVNLAGLGVDPNAEIKPGVIHPSEQADLLVGIQKRLYTRSRGKFYRSRFSRVTGVVPLELIAVVILVLLLVTYVCTTFISGLKPAEPHPVPAHVHPP